MINKKIKAQLRAQFNEGLALTKVSGRSKPLPYRREQKTKGIEKSSAKAKFCHTKGNDKIKENRKT